MEIIADLHLHSKYSRAVSKDMTLPVMAKYALTKGLNLLTAADFTHPLWFKEIGKMLEEREEGIYGLKTEEEEKQVHFLLSTEISSIYKEKDKLRRIHNLIFVPSFAVAEKISKELLKRGCNLASDGRPIIGLSSRTLLELVLGIDERAFLIPCHIWTPHFGLYGSASGYNSISESFGDLSNYIYGIETGLSSDPEMNWRIEELKTRSILSFSDAHSPAKMGREATVFIFNKNGMTNDKLQIANYSYNDILQAVKRNPQGKFKVGYTIEFYPEEGKYHYSGHRNCQVVLDPSQINTSGNICPACRRRLTEGVMFRVQELASLSRSGLASLPSGIMEEKINQYGLKWFTDKSHCHPSYVKLVPLLEIIAESMGATVAAQKVKNAYINICKELGSELSILLKCTLEEIEKIAGERIAEGVGRVRKGTIQIDPGYDGVYGKVKIWDGSQKESPQLRLEI